MRSSSLSASWIAGALILALPVAAATPGDPVQVRLEDRDGDGEPEIVVENRHLSVAVMTGIPPQPQPEPGKRRFWSRRQPAAKPPAPKYGTRFVGPGWIQNVVSRQTGRRWFVNDAPQGRHWHGIPEEFDEAVRMVEIEPGVWQCLKIGVGICRGTGWCTRGTLTLLDPGVWERQTLQHDDGSVELRFVHTVAAPSGHAYRYEKSLRIRPDDSRILFHRRLVNAGSQPLATTWYTHAFWGQSVVGETYDDACWTTIPLRSLRPDAPPADPLNTEPCIITNRNPANYWGVLDGAALAGTWFASGNRDTGDVFVSAISDTPAYYRNWTYDKTYSCEPFRVIDLAPGEADEWHEMAAVGVGLDRVDAHDGVAAYRWDWADATRTHVNLTVLPWRPVTGGTLIVTPADVGTGAAAVSLALASAGPDAPVTLSVPARPGVPLALRLETAAPPAVGFAWPAAAIVPGERRWQATWNGDAGGAGAVIFADMKRDDAGNHVPTRAAAYLEDYLRRAGFSARLCHPGEGWDSVDWSRLRLAVFAGVGRLAPDRVRQLEAFVDGGGGLVLCGPLDLGAFEFSSLLPVETVLATIEAGGAPRDCTRDFLGASQRRYHAVAAAEHPAIADLPLYPDAHQDIARLQVVRPRPQAQVLLRYATPPGLAPAVDAPMLLTSRVGEGRVAVFTCAPDWGLPPLWCTWSRLGEYHRKLFVQTALWSASVPTSAVP